MGYPLAGKLADRVGAFRLFFPVTVVWVVIAYPLFAWVLASPTPGRVFAAQMVATVVLSLMSGPSLAASARKAHAVAKMSGLDGAALGTIDFAQTNHGVLVTFDLHGLSPGAHAIHVHTSGNCDAKVKFTSAGPHFSPEPGKNHGFLMKGGPHPGDLPNQFADAQGVLHAATITNKYPVPATMPIALTSDIPWESTPTRIGKNEPRPRPRL